MIITKTKRLLAVALSLCLLLCAAPLTASAASSAQPLTTLLADGVDLLSTDSGSYPTGVSYNAETNTLTLNNATLEGDGKEGSECITAVGEGELNLVLVGENTISNYFLPINAEWLDTLNISGEGLLAISGNNYNSPRTIECNNLNIRSGTLNITNTGNGIEVNGELNLSGGKTTFSVGSYGFACIGDANISGGELVVGNQTAFGDAYIAIYISSNHGNIYMTGGTLDLFCAGACLYSENNTYLLGGTATLETRQYYAVIGNNSLTVSDKMELSAFGSPALYSQNGDVIVANTLISDWYDEVHVTNGVASFGYMEQAVQPTTIEIDGVNFLQTPQQSWPAGVSYDSATNTLTLNNATLSVNSTYGIQANGDLTVNLVGENVIGGNVVYASIYAYSLNITGNGSLKTKAGYHALYGMRDVDIAVGQSSRLELVGNFAAIHSVIGSVTICGSEYTGFSKIDCMCGDKALRVENGAYSLAEYKSPITELAVDGVDLLTADQSEYPKGVSYDKAKQLLTLDNAIIKGDGSDPYLNGIKFEGELTINAIGESTIGGELEGEGTPLGSGIVSYTGTAHITGEGTINIPALTTAIYAYNQFHVDDGVTINFSTEYEDYSIICTNLFVGDKVINTSKVPNTEGSIKNGELIIPSRLSSLEYRVGGGAWQAVPDFTADFGTRFEVTLPREVGQDGTQIELRATTRGEEYELLTEEASTQIYHNTATAAIKVYDSDAQRTLATVNVVFKTETEAADLGAAVFSFNCSESGTQQTSGSTAAALTHDETADLKINGLSPVSATRAVGDVRYIVIDATIDDESTSRWNEAADVAEINAATLTAGEHAMKLTVRRQVYMQVLTGMDANGEHIYSGSWVDNIGTQQLTANFTVAPMYGDINSDLVINAKDVLLLKQWLADWDVSISNETADCNGDGEINAKDLLRLRQYLADWDVNLF